MTPEFEDSRAAIRVPSFRALVLPREVLRDLRRHAEDAYPEECCGLLIGTPEGRVTRAVPIPNVDPGDKTAGYTLAPLAFRDAERAAERAGDVVLGVYHSHPDHPPEPSARDQECAWPDYVYVILSVVAGKAGEIRAWTWPESREAAALPIVGEG